MKKHIVVHTGAAPGTPLLEEREALDAPDIDLRLRLHKAISELSDRLRAVFVMHDVEGYKHEEIAGALSIPVGTSKARLSRARDQLRRALAGSLASSAGKEGR